MNIKATLAVVAICATFSASNVHADGSHGIKISITSGVKRAIEVAAYNGNDTSLWVPHKVYYIQEKGGSRTVKCHGNGTHVCKLAIKPEGDNEYFFYGEVRNGKTCTVKNNTGTWAWGVRLTKSEELAKNLVCQ